MAHADGDYPDLLPEERVVIDFRGTDAELAALVQQARAHFGWGVTITPRGCDDANRQIVTVCVLHGEPLAIEEVSDDALADFREWFPAALAAIRTEKN